MPDTPPTPASTIAAIDSHAHYGRYVGGDPLIAEFMSGLDTLPAAFPNP